MRKRAALPHPYPVPSPGTDFALLPMSQDYYFYLASNWQSAGSVHIDMMSYRKIYDVKPGYQLPERIFLDKGTSYRFSIFLTVRGRSFKSELELGLWARPCGRDQVESEQRGVEWSRGRGRREGAGTWAPSTGQGSCQG